MKKIAVLTTDTTHHRFFISKLTELFKIQLVVNETSSIKAPFETAHPFESLREKYEKEFWGPSALQSMRTHTEVLDTENINDASVVSTLKKLEPDVVIDFGTRKVLEPVFSIAKHGTWNLHGGNPERYRGLDTHLWAIYHSEFDQISTTLHYLEKDLDTGSILNQKNIPLTRGMKLFELRARNTEVCIDLVAETLKNLESGKLTSKKQGEKGRYYSFMPSVLKEVCVSKFERYTSTLL